MWGPASSARELGVVAGFIWEVSCVILLYCIVGAFENCQMANVVSDRENEFFLIDALFPRCLMHSMKDASQRSPCILHLYIRARTARRHL